MLPELLNEKRCVFLPGCDIHVLIACASRVFSVSVGGGGGGGRAPL